MVINKIDIDKIVSEEIIKTFPSAIVFEDEYRIVFKELGTISEYGKAVEKRVQIIQWKKVASQELFFDIRYYDTVKKIYTKGISLNAHELKELLEVLKHFNLADLD